MYHRPWEEPSGSTSGIGNGIQFPHPSIVPTQQQYIMQSQPPLIGVNHAQQSFAPQQLQNYFNPPYQYIQPQVQQVGYFPPQAVHVQQPYPHAPVYPQGPTFNAMYHLPFTQTPLMNPIQYHHVQPCYEMINFAQPEAILINSEPDPASDMGNLNPGYPKDGQDKRRDQLQRSLPLNKRHFHSVQDQISINTPPSAVVIDPMSPFITHEVPVYRRNSEGGKKSHTRGPRSSETSTSRLMKRSCGKPHGEPDKEPEVTGAKGSKGLRVRKSVNYQEESDSSDAEASVSEEGDWIPQTKDSSISGDCDSGPDDLGTSDDECDQDGNNEIETNLDDDALKASDSCYKRKRTKLSLYTTTITGNIVRKYKKLRYKFRPKNETPVEILENVGQQPKHTQPKKQPNKCEICEAVFNTSSSLHKHKKTHDKKIFECDECEYKTCRRDQLKEHKKTHSNETPYQCSICDKKIKTRLGFFRHKQNHENKREYTCDVCGAAFNTSSALSTHKKTHGEKIFKCDECNFKSCRRDSLIRHKRIHS